MAAKQQIGLMKRRRLHQPNLFYEPAEPGYTPRRAIAR